MKARVTKEGIVIPKRLLNGAEEVEIRKERNLILIVPHFKRDPLLNLGTNPVSCNAPDASENLDKHLLSALITGVL